MTENDIETCGICGNREKNQLHTVREMMLGLGDPFVYQECGQCGCFQLLHPPADWSKYYPRDYYSMSFSEDGSVKRFLKRFRARHTLGKRSLLGNLLVRAWGPPPFVRWIDPVHLGWDDAVLDVGSGRGQVLIDMKHAGFSNLTGIDPYLASDFDSGPGLRIMKKDLDQMQGQFDFAMMNHSFEHMRDPAAALREIARLLRPGHLLMVRTPMAGKFAWRQYGSNWVQLDAPRHCFVHSEKSVCMLAERAGFALKEIRYHSTAFQFWGSEQYKRGIPLFDPRSYAVNQSSGTFTKAEILAFEQKATELNQQHDGDEAGIYLLRR